MSDTELLAEIRRVIGDSPFHGEGYRKIRARLRHAVGRVWKECVLRLMRYVASDVSRISGRKNGLEAYRDIQIETPHPGTRIPGSILCLAYSANGGAFLFGHRLVLPCHIVLTFVHYSCSASGLLGEAGTLYIRAATMIFRHSNITARQLVFRAYIVKATADNRFTYRISGVHQCIPMMLPC